MQLTGEGSLAIYMQRRFKLYSEGKFELYLFFGKRFFDIILSLVALIILFPIMILISVLIKLFDSGPIIFKQKRVGMNGKLFYMYKFRSMPVNTKNIASDKITELNLNFVSKFIRRTNIDELPQLFNILKSDMSFVGPRPALSSQNDLIEIRLRKGVLSFKPGLTGLAQISSYDGMSVNTKVDFDKKYINSISFTTDILIILKTFFYMLKPPPIY